MFNAGMQISLLHVLQANCMRPARAIGLAVPLLSMGQNAQLRSPNSSSNNMGRGALLPHQLLCQHATIQSYIRVLLQSTTDTTYMNLQMLFACIRLETQLLQTDW